MRFFVRIVRRHRRKPSKSKEYQLHKEHARKIITARVRHFAQTYGFVYGRISIRNNVSRWGSCSRAGNLNFHYRIAFLAPELLDYVVVHELCHLREFNHLPAFWQLVQNIIPEYQSLRARLRREHL